MEDFEERDEFDFELDHDCPLTDIVIGMSMIPKPFGFIWNLEKIEKFLITRGYKILERYSDDNKSYKVAVKPDSSYIPSENCSNLRKVFENEVEDILLEWLTNLNK